MTKPGEIGLLFEGAGYARIGLLRLDLDTILKQADRAADASKTP